MLTVLIYIAHNQALFILNHSEAFIHFVVTTLCGNKVHTFFSVSLSFTSIHFLCPFFRFSSQLPSAQDVSISTAVVLCRSQVLSFNSFHVPPPSPERQICNATKHLFDSALHNAVDKPDSLSYTAAKIYRELLETLKA